MRWLVLIVLAGLLAGCASQEAPRDTSPGYDEVERDADSAHRELERATGD